MVNIKDANEDIKKIAARNNTAVFVVGDMFNEQINNNFHYDYQRLIDEVSKANGRDMTRELIEQDVLSPLPYGEYEINFDYGENTTGQYKNAGNIALISSLDDDIGVLYHEAGHILQTEYNLFNDKELNNKYGKSLSFKDIFKYKSFLKEQHSESFAFAAMMLRSEKAFDLAKSAIKAWKRGVKHSALAFSKTSDSYNNNNAAFYATFPVMIKTIRECLKIRRQGQTQQFFTPDGRLDDKKLALLCQDIVYKSAYSPQKFKNFFIENLQDKTNKIDYIYKKGKMHFLKGLAFFVPNNKDWDKVKQKQQALMDKNKAKFEDLLGVSYEDFNSSRISVKRLSEMGHLTPTYLKKIILSTKDAAETKLALEVGANANAQDEYGTTALMRAETAEQIKALVEAGADVNIQNKYGKTALMKADTLEKAKQLVLGGAKLPDNFNSRLTPEEIEELKQLKTAPKPSKKNLLTQKLEHLRNLLKSNKHKKAHTEIPEKSQSENSSSSPAWSDFPSMFNDNDKSSR